MIIINNVPMEHNGLIVHILSFTNNTVIKSTQNSDVIVVI